MTTSFWLDPSPREGWTAKCIQHFEEVAELEVQKRQGRRISGMFPIGERSKRAKALSASANVSTAAMKRNLYLVG